MPVAGQRARLTVGLLLARKPRLGHLAEGGPPRLRCDVVAEMKQRCASS